MKKHIFHILVAGLLVSSLCAGFVGCNQTDAPATDATQGSDAATQAEVMTDENGSEIDVSSDDTASSESEPADSDPAESTPTESTSDEKDSDVADPGDNTVAPGTEENPIRLTFNGTSCEQSVDGTLSLSEDGRAFVISKGGFYTLSGDLSDGQIMIAVPKTEEITLTFKNFSASSSKSAPIYIDSCDKATIILAPGTVNTLSDATTYQFSDPTEDKPNACIYSADDLTIKGDGTLNITANYNNGIGCKNDLRIKSGTITISAPNNILKGNDSVTIEGGNVTLSGGEDAIKSDTTDRTDKGFILIEGDAKVTITCSDDALQATQSVTVAAGTTVTVTAGGNAINCPGTINADESAMNIISEGAADAE